LIESWIIRDIPLFWLQLKILMGIGQELFVISYRLSVVGGQLSVVSRQLLVDSVF